MIPRGYGLPLGEDEGDQACGGRELADPGEFVRSMAHSEYQLNR
jgi:hypothetical protein